MAGDKKAYGRCVREAREAAGMSGRALATKLGVSNTYVAAVEAGRVLPFTVERTQAVAKLLHIPLTRLLLERSVWTGDVPLPASRSWQKNMLAAALASSWASLDDADVNAVAQLLKELTSP